MSNDSARRALAILESALDVEPDKRETWVKGACEGDQAVEAEVLSMLQLLPESSGFLPVPDEAESFAATRGGVLPPGSAGAAVTSGDQIGDFRIEERIGVGGMGVVYRARQISLDRDVALKILPSSLQSSATAADRFRREVEAAARLNHENIVAVFTMGEDGGTPYYAMELIDGFPLNKVIQHFHAQPISAVSSSTVDERYRFGPAAMVDTVPDWAVDALLRRSPEEPGGSAAALSKPSTVGEADYFRAVAVGLADVADGLHYAHEHQVIHRDIKPSNLLLSSCGRLHVSDFGLARLLDEPGLTRSGEMVGTAYYMAPEQIMPGIGVIDRRTDIYSMGATLFELLTLRPPFLGDTRDQVISQILDSEPTPPQRINRLVPADLQTICLKALEKEPASRYASAADLAADLRAFASGSSILARRSGPFAQTKRVLRRHKVMSLSLTAAVCLAALAAFFAYRARESERRWNDQQRQSVFEEAVLAAMQGDPERAAEEIERAQELGASEGQLHLLRGQAAWHSARYGTAYENFALAAEQLPDSLAAQSLLALALMRRQSYARGEAMMPSIRRLTPERLEDYLYHARIENYYDSELAVQLLDEAVARDKTSIVARLVRGDVRLARAVDSAAVADAETAVSDFQIAAELLGLAPIVASGLLRSHLAAASAYGAVNEDERRAEHLEQAAAIAEELATPPVSTQAHRLRALYFDYRGEIDLAIAEWREIEDNQIVFLILTLYREARFAEARDVCAGWLEGHDANRMTDFFQAFIIAADAGSEEEVRGQFSIDKGTRLDPMHELIITQTMGGLLADREAAEKEGRRIRALERLPTFRHNWYRQLVQYACGDLPAEELLRTATDSRRDSCEANFYVGIRMLGEGDREAALRHFRASVAAGVYNYFEHFLSLALVRQLERDSQWPPWIARPS